MKVNFKKIKEFFVKRIGVFKVFKEWFSQLKKFIFLVIGYGFLINTMLWSLLGFEFTKYSLVGYGILYYLIKEEF
ncbi:hypothetical protein LCGC14_3086600 [marine sediment metagenome]|uniref:Uncharacterized protein n=1 Tax=marine sediment metagenome TaxID=412755 RepID=A0A0F8WBM0_9ZZZZ